ncbi:unnamed protein product [Paramecium octaurelia]|uniref:Uncharacterized protein n=1 Tax=Paramecium octaurelia TaxID=43137 RepID=A0A8S1V8H7_PAROT|nr:unnamed protein product [Paramecium octaurelia]
MKLMRQKPLLLFMDNNLLDILHSRKQYEYSYSNLVPKLIEKLLSQVEMTLSVDEMLRQPKRFYLKIIVTKTFFLGLNCHFNISQFQKYETYQTILRICQNLILEASGAFILKGAIENYHTFFKRIFEQIQSVSFGKCYYYTSI